MLTLENLTKRYGTTVILENTDYAFPRKGLVCLVGPSGGGKTTLLNLIAGFDTGYDGKITVDGTVLRNLEETELCTYRQTKIGFVFQNYHLLPGYTAIENALLALEFSNLEEEKARETASLMLEELGMSSKADQKVETLSGGQKQRIAIARALLGNPQMLLCDEPTGALDRKTSGEIMELLQEIAKEKLVIVITHDEKLLPFADEVLRIQDRTLAAQKKMPADTVLDDRDASDTTASLPIRSSAVHLMRRAKKNFKVHMKRYLAVAAAISIGLTAFFLSLSFGNVVDQSIGEFEAKNTALHNGYVKGSDDGTLLDTLQEDTRLENIYYQYPLSNLTLKSGTHSETMAEKLPMPKTAQSVSYGVMPRRGEKELALTPSLAKKFSDVISDLIGREITLVYEEEEHTLTISGIYNAGYDDFMISSDIEQTLYEGMEEQPNFSINYDVKRFEDIAAVSSSLKNQKIEPLDAAAEVTALLDTFQSLQRLFFVVSALVLLIALFLCTLLLVRQQNTRYREVGLLSALGFRHREISAILRRENLLLSSLAAAINLLLLPGAALAFQGLGVDFSLNPWQVLLCTAAAFLSILLIGETTSAKLIRTEPANALRK